MGSFMCAKTWLLFLVLFFSFSSHSSEKLESYIFLDQEFNDSFFPKPKDFGKYISRKFQPMLWISEDEFTEIRVSKFLDSSYDYLLDRSEEKLKLIYFPNPERKSLVLYGYEESVKQKQFEFLNVRTDLVSSTTMLGSGFDPERRSDGKQTDIVIFNDEAKATSLFVKHMGKSDWANLGFLISEYSLELFQNIGKPKFFDILPEFVLIDRKEIKSIYRSALPILTESSNIILPMHSLQGVIESKETDISLLKNFLKSRDLDHWLTKKLIPRFMDAVVEANLIYGLFPNAHTQNFLVEIEPKSGEVVKIHFRDMQDFGLDFSVLSIRNLDVDISELIKQDIHRIGYRTNVHYEVVEHREASLKATYYLNNLLRMKESYNESDLPIDYLRATKRVYKKYGIDLPRAFEFLELYSVKDYELGTRVNTFTELFLKGIPLASLNFPLVILRDVADKSNFKSLDNFLSPKLNAIRKIMDTGLGYRLPGDRHLVQNIYFAVREHELQTNFEGRLNEAFGRLAQRRLKTKLKEAFNNGGLEWIDITHRKSLAWELTGNKKRKHLVLGNKKYFYKDLENSIAVVDLDTNKTIAFSHKKWPYCARAFKR